jgi:hypothetical protein
MVVAFPDKNFVYNKIPQRNIDYFWQKAYNITGKALDCNDSTYVSNDK